MLEILRLYNKSIKILGLHKARTTLQIRIIRHILLGELKFQEDQNFHGRDTMIQLILPLPDSYTTQRISMMNKFMYIPSANLSSLKMIGLLMKITQIFSWVIKSRRVLF